MQAFECHGLWNLPDADAPGVAGTLRVSAGGDLRLSVIGSLGSKKGLYEHPVILGSVDGPLGNEITLTNCFVAHSTFNSIGVMREEYHAQRGFFGAHLSEPSDFAFRRTRIRVGGLSAWSNSLSGFGEVGLGLGGTRAGEKAPLLYYSMPAPAGGPIRKGEISLGFSLMSTQTLDSRTFTQQPGVVVTLDSPLSENEINQRFVYPLQNLMTFVSDRAQAVEETILWREDILTLMGDNPEIRVIGARLFPETEDEEAEPTRPHELLFRLSDIEDGFAAFIDRWFRLTRDYSDTCDIFFALQYGPPAYLELTFLGVIESLSLYYTRREDGVVHRNKEAQRLTEVLRQLPRADADWVRSHIWARPFPPLHDILAKLLDEHTEVMNALFRTDQNGFVSEVMNTLNFALRRDPEVGLTASHGAELYWIIAKLRILVKLCLLHELGFSEAKRHSFFDKNPAYVHLRQTVSSQRTQSKP